MFTFLIEIKLASFCYEIIQERKWRRGIDVYSIQITANCVNRSDEASNC
jgi:hypothetical protein